MAKSNTSSTVSTKIQLSSLPLKTTLLETSNKGHIHLFEGLYSQEVLKATYIAYENKNHRKDQDSPLSIIKINEKHSPTSPPIGIIGGMGPLATLFFIKRLYAVQSIPTVTFMCTKAPDRKASFENKAKQAQLEELMSDVSSFLINDYGCQSIILPCNTAHIFAKRIPKFKSLISTTSTHLKTQNIEEIMILSTETTVKAQLFNHVAPHVHYPSRDVQALITRIIYDEIKTHNTITEEAISLFKQVITKAISSGITTFGLCCTELPIVADDPRVQDFISSLPNKISFIDPTEILIQTLA